MTLIITWEEFTSKIAELLIQYEDLERQLPPIKTDVELDALEEKIKQWATIGKEFIENSFTPKNSDEGREFFYSSQPRYNIPNSKKYIDQRKRSSGGF